MRVLSEQPLCRARRSTQSKNYSAKPFGALANHHHCDCARRDRKFSRGGGLQPQSACVGHRLSNCGNDTLQPVQCHLLAPSQSCCAHCSAGSVQHFPCACKPSNKTSSTQPPHPPKKLPPPQLTGDVVDVLLSLLHASDIVLQAGELIARLGGVVAQQVGQLGPVNNQAVDK